MVSAGPDSTCVVRADRSIACWGEDMTAPPAGSFITVSAGGTGGCAIRTDGTLACWSDESDAPAPPSGTFVAVDGAGDMVCAIHTDGTLACWGNDAARPPSGRFRDVAVGNGSTGSLGGCAIRADGAILCWADAGGQALTAPSGRFIDVSLGASFACAVREDGTLACWGDATGERDHGQLHPPAGTYTAVASGGDHSCAVRVDGHVVCWGDDTRGQASPPDGTFTAVSSGDGHSCGQRDDGKVVCWGDDAAGEVALEAGAGRGAAAGVAPRALSVSVAWGHVCIIKLDRTLACWGESAPPPSGRFLAVAAGAESSDSCAIRENGALVCWGEGSLSRPPGGQYKAVSVSGDGVACAVRTDSRVVCWVDDVEGGGVLPALKGRFRDVVAGGEYACGLRTDGRIACWADEEAEEATTPPTGTFTTLAGNGPVCGLRVDGSVVCSDSDMEGTGLPNGRYIAIAIGAVPCGVRVDGEIECAIAPGSQTTPPALPSGPFTALSLGADEGCAIRTTGELACWGLAARIVEASAPVARLEIIRPSSVGNTIPVRWTANDPASGIASYDVRYRGASAPGRWTIWGTGLTPTTSSIRLEPPIPGETYEIQVRARAADGQLSDWANGDVTMPQDDTVLHADAGWTPVSGQAYYGGSALRATRKGARLTLDVSGTDLDIVVTTCPTCGTIRLSIEPGPGEDEVGPPDPVTIDLRSGKRADRRQLDVFSDDTDLAVAGTLVIEVLSSGRPVMIDGVLTK